MNFLETIYVGILEKVSSLLQGVQDQNFRIQIAITQELCT